MCGIAGFISTQPQMTGTIHTVLNGIESRGGHAWGWATNNQHYKQIGKVPTITSQLKLPEKPKIMIMHSRWATHGSADDINCAHPFVSAKWAIVHNGVIDNEHGNQKTKCDSEAILKILIEKDSIKAMTEELIGQFRIAIINRENNHLFIINDSQPVYFGKRFQDELWFGSEEKHLPADSWMKKGKPNTILEVWIEKKEICTRLEQFTKKVRPITYTFQNAQEWHTETKRIGFFNYEACKTCEERSCYRCPLVGGFHGL